jgi:SAM-dependent methyltransferase
MKSTSLLHSALKAGSQAPVLKYAYRAVMSASRRMVSLDQAICFSSARDREMPDAVAEMAGLTDLVVQNGPFAGMRYARALPSGSIFYPKLLGSYEAELKPVFERIIRTNYAAVVDVGCADGYFAVGLAMRMPGVIVYAYDIDPSMREICAANAEVNGVSERVRISPHCDAEELRRLDLGDRAFILCDCEGFEIELFPPDIVDHLANHDLVIELHDFIDITIRDTLRERFSGTHNATLIDSVDDYLKGDVFHFPQLMGKSRALKKDVMSERRPAIMQWLVLHSKRHAQL